MLHSDYRLGKKISVGLTLRNHQFTARFIQRILGSVFRGSLLVNGIDTELTEERYMSAEYQQSDGLITVRPASSKPSICSNAILASSALLYLR